MCVPCLRRPIAVSLASALLIGACSTPPQPPAVQESRRRPANTALAVELQACRSELHNSRIDAAEAARRADHAMAIADRMVALQQAIELIRPMSPAPAPTPTPAASQVPAASSAPTACPPVTSEVLLPSANRIYTVQFEHGSSRVSLPPEVLSALLAQARQAPLVMLRGRTDGTHDVAVEVRIARERAMAVKAHLVAAGLDASRIRTTWQPTGDHAADNGTPDGQARNRRVEIEVYAALPTVDAPRGGEQP